MDPEDYESSSDDAPTEFDDVDDFDKEDECEKFDPTVCDLTVQCDRVAELDMDELNYI